MQKEKGYYIYLTGFMPDMLVGFSAFVKKRLYLVCRFGSQVFLWYAIHRF